MDTRLTRSVAAMVVAVLLTASTPLLAAPVSGAESLVASFGLQLDQLWTGVVDLFTKSGTTEPGEGTGDGGFDSGLGTMDPDGQPLPDPDPGNGG